MVLSPSAAGRPTLSVVVLNYNYGRFLAECLASILAQSFHDYELILIDDASTDDSLNVAARFSADRRLRVCPHQANRGFVASLIEGTESLSSGEFLMVISADDLVLESDAFAVQVAALRENTRCVAAISGYAKLGPRSGRAERTLFKHAGVIPAETFGRRLRTDREFTVLHSGTMIRAESYRRAGGYRSDLTNYLDLAMWLALSRVGPVAYVARSLYGYRVHGSQFSGSASRRRAVLQEGLALLDAEVRECQARGRKVSRARVLRARIADLALADAFAGRRVRGLQRCLDAAALAPGVALTCSGWWLAGIRSVLGTRGWSVAAKVRHRLG